MSCGPENATALRRNPKPRPSDLARTYYHGTSKEGNALRVMSEGLLPDMRPDAKGFLKPVSGKTYLTPRLGYALIYALGGDYAGHTPMSRIVETDGRYGYVFGISGLELKDIQPDEDSVGEMVTEGSIEWLRSFARDVLTPNQFRKALYGDCDWQAHAGKKLLKHMSDSQKMALIDAGAHIAHEGAIQPDRCWRIDKTQSKEYARDGSNLFQLAEEIPMWNYRVLRHNPETSIHLQWGPSPLSYPDGLKQRVAVVDPSAPAPTSRDTYFAPTARKVRRSPTGREYKTPRIEEVLGAAEGAVAFLDYVNYPDFVYVAYMRTRNDQLRQGHARRLVEALVDRYGTDKLYEFGDVFHEGAWRMMQLLRECGLRVHGKMLF